MRRSYSNMPPGSRRISSWAVRSGTRRRGAESEQGDLSVNGTYFTRGFSVRGGNDPSSVNENQVEFDSLTDLITSNIQVQGWAETGGGSSAAPSRQTYRSWSARIKTAKCAEASRPAA